MKMQLNALGLMSGTSMDGVDAALIVTDGESVSGRLASASRPYARAERDLLERAVDDANGLRDRLARPGALAEAEDMVTRAHAEAVLSLFGEVGLDKTDVDVIGFHGQTVLHRPEIGLTVQLGDGQLLADLTGTEVVFDMRAADMAAGGQGAPLVPAYHRALAAGASFELPVVFVNIGGVSNVTWIGDGDDILAFDTGPGNALIDDWVRRHTGAAMDADGALAAKGKADEAVLAKLMDNDFFAASPPKSLDKLDFTLNGFPALTLENGAATLTAFTAAAVAASAKHMPRRPRRWVVSGGGARNPSLLTALAARVDAPVVTAAETGCSPDFVEAEAFAFLAVRSLKGLPLTFPGTTGVPRPQTGGVRVSPRRQGAKRAG